jgi:HAE1 family hydrophobic/amphiphilic exporter-1
MMLFLGILGADYLGFTRLPTGFVPPEDQGWVLATAQLPDAASLERTLEVVDKVNKIYADMDGVKTCIAIPGFSILDGSQTSNAAAFWIMLDPWEERTTPELSMNALVGKMMRSFQSIQEAQVLAIVPPAIPGLGVAGGFQMQLQDRGSVGLTALQQMAAEMAHDANGQKGLFNVYTPFRANVPQIFAEIDRTKAKTLNVPLSSIFNTLQAYLGSAYVNDFNKFGRTFRVYVQADPAFRADVQDIRRLEVRNNQGRMIPLGTLVTTDDVFGPQLITRYNMYPAASIMGSAAPGYSSGQALRIMENMAESKLPANFGFEWTGMSYQERATGGQAVFIFALAVIFVYLVLCAQYESWSLSFGVIMSVPLGILGAITAVLIRGMDINVYTQIGFVLLIALASKNAILIIEFARDSHQSGLSIQEAAAEAARLRFRPILMTSFAFIFGTFPLVVATGAAAASRRALGTAVFGGMIAATVLAVIFVPVFYVVIQNFSEWFSRKTKSSPKAKTVQEPPPAATES